MNRTIVPPNVRNLIFDLGGVIINLSFQRTHEAFNKLSGMPVEEIVELSKTREEFVLYEIGMISSNDFRNFIRMSMRLHASDVEIDAAWNAMLLDIPMERLKVLRALRTNYRTFLLSNTNAIHLEAFAQILRNVSGSADFNTYFDKVYYSHEMGMRKPNEDIYGFVLQESDLEPTETLFLDDTAMNFVGAKAVGLQTFHVTDADELFKELGKLK